MEEEEEDTFHHYWILEFILRQPLPEFAVNGIFRSLPLPPPSTDPLPLRLKKMILIRRIAARPIFESSLFALELIYEDHLSYGAFARCPSLLPLTQKAYLGVAVGSTLNPLRNGDLPEFFDAVRRTWTMRVEDLLASEEARGLASVGLVEWKRKMEMAAEEGMGEMRDEVLREWRAADGVAAVREYLVAELEAMGKPLLEIAAEEHFGFRGGSGGDGDGDCVVVDQGREQECAEDNNGDRVMVEEVDESSEDVDCDECNVLGEERDVETQEEVDASSHGVGNDDFVEIEGRDGEMAGQGVKQTILGVSSRGIDTAFRSEVNKVKEDLRRNCEGMQNAVEDPLLKANKAESIKITSCFERPRHPQKPTDNEASDQNESEQGQTVLDFSAPGHPAEKDSTVPCNGNRSSDIELSKNLNKLSGYVGSKGLGNDDCVEIEGGVSNALGRGEEMSGQEKAGLGASSRRTNAAFCSVPSPEVKRVKENLKRSLEDLQHVVEDPLPNAKKAACRIIASRSKEVLHLEKPTENRHLNEPGQNQNEVNVSAPDHCADKGSEVIHNGSTSADAELNKNSKRASAHSLMDWNQTARTYGWEDESIESGSENEASVKKFQLPSPRTMNVSPLKPVEVQKKPRKRKKWSLEEEDALRAGVNKYGKGKWSLILKDSPDTFEDRTEVDLKDKWRNMTKP